MNYHVKRYTDFSRGWSFFTKFKITQDVLNHNSSQGSGIAEKKIYIYIAEGWNLFRMAIGIGEGCLGIYISACSLVVLISCTTERDG